MRNTRDPAVSLPWRTQWDTGEVTAERDGMIYRVYTEVIPASRTGAIDRIAYHLEITNMSTAGRDDRVYMTFAQCKTQATKYAHKLRRMRKTRGGS